MVLRRNLRLGFLGAALGAAGASAAEPDLIPAAGGHYRKAAPVLPSPATTQPSCPPGVTTPPSVTGPTAPAPKPPAQPSPGNVPDLPPLIGSTPPANTPPGVDAALAPSANSLAQATQGGGGAERTALPQVFGDLPGNGAIAGPLPAFSSPTGLLAGPPIFVNLANGQRVQIGGPITGAPLGSARAQDELIRARAAGATNVVSVGPPGSVSTVPTPGSTPVALYPAPGSVFDPSLAGLVSRIPEFVRGAFKITENDSPRPTSRAYLTYNFYDEVYNSSGGPFVSRTMLHQEIFGLEYAFANRQFSVGVRMPYNQIVSTGLFNDTSIGDLTLIGKAVLLEDRETGDLLSGGLALTIPTGSQPFASTLTGVNPRGTLIQPWLGHVLVWNDRLFTQGFTAVVAPTSGGQATFFSNDLAAGYFVYRNPTGFVSGVVPTIESHLNIPFNNVGIGGAQDSIGFVNQLTVLAGSHFMLKDAGSVGFAVGAPITGPRPFSLQATVQFNVRY